MTLLRAGVLFMVTAVAEIIGCYLPHLWLRKGKSAFLLLPAALSLAAFAWLLTLHPTGAARTYAAYGGVYVTVAVLWLWLVEGKAPTRWDVIGCAVAVTGMAIIVLGHSAASGPQPNATPTEEAALREPVPCPGRLPSGSRARTLSVNILANNANVAGQGNRGSP